MKKQQGFGVVEIILIVVILGLIGFVGWYFWQNQQKATDSTPAKTDTTSQAPPAQTETTSYLTISEWGVKVKLGSADPSQIEYTLSGATSDPGGPISAQVILKLKASVTTNESCRTLGIGINQRTVANAITSGKTVGQYSYDTAGSSPYACGDTALDQLRQQYTGDNSSTWEYSAN